MRTCVWSGPCVALLCGVVTVALAESPPTSSSSLPEVTIQAQREAIKEEARQFVSKVTGSGWASAEDRPLELWRTPVCVAVVGLRRPQGELIFNRVSQAMTEAEVKIGKSGCAPNLIIVVTTQPEAILSAWQKRDKRMFGAAARSVVKQFFDQALPVRIWYNTSLTGQNANGVIASSGLNSAAAMGGGGGSGESGSAMSSNQASMMLAEIPTFKAPDGGSRLSLTAVRDLSSVIVVVDLNQCQGIDWGGLADYIAMAALANVDLHTQFGDVPSILALFGAPADKRPAGLTDWDRAYLKALYRTDHMSPQQRLLIREQMVREMDPLKTAIP